MSLRGVERVVLGFHPDRPIEVETSTAQLSSDAGLLVVREFDERIRLTEQVAAALGDAREATAVVHGLLSMVRQRIYGILAGYEDQNDHDVLRSDPVFKLIADRLPNDGDLASQPTLSRFENAVTIADLWRLRDALIDQFVQSFETPPARITLDIDAFDDPAHGAQQLVLFHGYYDQHQYLPLAITCAENDAVLLVSLRHGSCAAALGADDDLRYVVERLRAVWPDVEIRVRGDCGLGVPSMYAVCEELDATYTFGLGMNPRLKAASDALLAECTARFAETGEPQREFVGLWYRAGSWDCPRFVVVKVEVDVQGTNRRAVVSNRPGAPLLPRATYDEYVERGESENRNKELKVGMQADRLSDHRFVANFFRLYLHVLALNLLVRLRRAVAQEPSRSPGLDDPLPTEALPPPRRRTWFNRRRRDDPLGEGQPDTWRTRLIKVAAEIVVSARRVLVRLSSSWPYLDHFAEVARRLAPPPTG